MIFIQGARLFNPKREKHVLKRAGSHRCEVNTLRKFACNFSTFFKVSRRELFLDDRLHNLKGVADFSQKNF